MDSAEYLSQQPAEDPSNEIRVIAEKSASLALPDEVASDASSSPKVLKQILCQLLSNADF